MAFNRTTAAIIDNVLLIAVSGAAIGAAVIAPNVIQALDKPLQKYLDGFDKRGQKREWQRIVAHMKRQGLISIPTEDYEHGVRITSRGRARAEKARIEGLSIKKPRKWDKKWRFVLFDIPETRKVSRDTLTEKLRSLGFRQLQRSVWLHPYPCREEIEALT